MIPLAVFCDAEKAAKPSKESHNPVYLACEWQEAPADFDKALLDCHAHGSKIMSGAQMFSQATPVPAYGRKGRNRLTMTTILAPVESPVRTHGRGQLLSILGKERLLTRLNVVRDGRFVAKTVDWSSYWKPLLDLGCWEVEDSLEALHSAWLRHIRSGFDSHERQEFCFRYFALLDVLLSSRNEALASHSWYHALQTILGFECFGIIPADSVSEVLAAGTCQLRNPCYLLAKLRMPDALDDPQFLPVITVAGCEKPELFYHYRQHNLASDSPMSLLFYPAISETKRSASFKLLNSLISGVSGAIDPRTRERAQRLCQGIV